MEKNTQNEEFKPKGAIAFFIALLALCAGIWYYIYSLMLNVNK